MARGARIIYHHEPEGWWAESPDIERFTAAGATFAEVREQAHDGVVFFTGEDLEIDDLFADVDSARASEQVTMQPSRWVQVFAETCGAIVRPRLSLTNLSHYDARSWWRGRRADPSMETRSA
jgi:predicted RNase H-like HicB family nuclease